MRDETGVGGVKDARQGQRSSFSSPARSSAPLGGGFLLLLILLTKSSRRFVNAGRRNRDGRVRESRTLTNLRSCGASRVLARVSQEYHQVCVSTLVLLDSCPPPRGETDNTMSCARAPRTPSPTRMFKILKTFVDPTGGDSIDCSISITRVRLSCSSSKDLT